jgi:uncharacterized protein (DUF433 family)
LGDSVRVKQLLMAGANPTACNEYFERPLDFAVAGGDATTVKLILDAGADPSVYHQISPLRAAAREGHAEIVKLLLSHGASAREADVFGIPLLQAAATREVIAMLIEAGADPDVLAANGEAPHVLDEDTGARSDWERRQGMDVRKWVECRPGTYGGKPVFRGRRLPVETLFSNLADDLPLADILNAYAMPRVAAQALLRESCDEIEREVFGKYAPRSSVIGGPYPQRFPFSESSEYSSQRSESRAFERTFRMVILLPDIGNNVCFDESLRAVVFCGTQLTVREFFDGLASGMRLADALKGEADTERAMKSAVRLLYWSCQRVVRSAVVDYFDSKRDVTDADRQLWSDQIRILEENWDEARLVDK